MDREIQRREQRDALRDAAGSWQAEDHPELAGGADEWVREMRRGSIRRSEKVERRRDTDEPLRRV
jgi:hypothetical protein